MKKWNRFIYGGDYNPNQWPQEVWQEDMTYFKEAYLNSATINVFSWAKIQPSEEEYDFDELDRIVAMLSQEGYDIVLATSTAAVPAWMYKKYPEVGRVDIEGRRHRFGRRHNACPNSPVYQRYAARMAGELARRYGSNPNLSCWHVNNEYGGECFCENCEKAFRVWIKNKYQTITALNKAWNLEFWGHCVYDWDEIVLPSLLSEHMSREKTAFAGLSIDYRRFNSESMLKNYMAERDAIRQFDQETPITTNMMGTYKELDYFKWAREVDIVSWDNYPAYDTPWSLVAMTHDLMRGLKNQPFMLMEQTPSQQNWQPYNSLKKPGQMRAQSYQSIAHGADTVQFFQLRRSAGACEKFHGAVIEHAGTNDTRVFREVAELGRELYENGTLLMGAKHGSEVGIIFDWDNYWALEYTSGPNRDLRYVDQIHQYYRYFYEQNISVDMIPVDADLSNYKMVVAPVYYMVKEGEKERIEAFVRNGGTFVTTFMSGIVDQSDNVCLGGYPGPFRELCGIWVEEIDALAPEQRNTLALADGTTGECGLLCDIIHLEGAEAIAAYTGNFYSGSPAATKHHYGAGHVYYIGTQPEPAVLANLLQQAVLDAGAEPVIAEKTALEVVCRRQPDCCLYFVMNFTEEKLRLPEVFAGQQDVLTGRILPGDFVLNKYDTLIIAD